MCIFCDIIAGKVPSPRLYEDENFIIINDISHRANKHYLIIPKKHYAKLSEQSEVEAVKLGKMLNKIPSLEKTLGIENGYRLVINQGEDAGQSVAHLHVHILGGEKLPIAP